MPDLKREGRSFQQLLNELMPYGAIVSVVDDKYQTLVPHGPVMFIAEELRVVGTRTNEEGEIVHDVVIGPEDWATDPSGTIVVTITDPAEEVRPGQHAFRLRDTFGIPRPPEIEHYLLINPDMTRDQVDRLLEGTR